MKMSPNLRRIISHKEGTEVLKEQALKEGMRTLKMSGFEYVLDGTTSFSEVVRISLDS
jgi:type IV pilus assembly protein PilB